MGSGPKTESPSPSPRSRLLSRAFSRRMAPSGCPIWGTDSLAFTLCPQSVTGVTILKDTSRSRGLSAAEAAVGVLRTAGRLLATLPAAGPQALLAGGLGNTSLCLPPRALPMAPSGSVLGVLAFLLMCLYQLPGKCKLPWQEQQTICKLGVLCTRHDAGCVTHSLSWPRVPAGSAHGSTRAAHTCAFPGCPLGSCSKL